MFVSSQRNPINTKQSVKLCKEGRFSQNFPRNIVQYSALFTTRHHRSSLSRGKSAWDTSDTNEIEGCFTAAEYPAQMFCCAQVHKVTSRGCKSLYWECCAEIVSVYNLKMRALQKEIGSLCLLLSLSRCRIFQVEALRSVCFWSFLPPTLPPSSPTTISNRDSFFVSWSIKPSQFKSLGVFFHVYGLHQIKRLSWFLWDFWCIIPVLWLANH